MIRMPPYPVRQDHDVWPRFANHASHFQTIFPGVFDASVGDVERAPPADAKDFGCVIRFTRAIVRGASRAHLALSQIEDAGALSTLGSFQ